MVSKCKLSGEEEEWKESNGGGGRGTGGGSEAIKKEEDLRDAVALAPTSPAPPPSPAVLPPPAAVPLLRVNPALATDPALRVPQEPEQASISSAQDEEEEDEVSWKEGNVKSEEADTESGSLKRRLVDQTTPPPPTPPPRPRQDQPTPTPSPRVHREDLSSPPPPVAAGPHVYLCSPCGIRFSSLSTLEAHQTYYCSHRMHAIPRVFPVVGGAESENEDVKSVVDKEETSGGESSSEPSGKAVRTGKQYKCPHCSYSADKKVSLNRHMRMHSASPGASERSASPQPAIDRYCQNCDIRFSSSKTFRAHKMHYCSTRHVVKQPKSGSIASPESPGEPRPSSPSRGGGSPVAITPRGVPHLQDHPAGPPQPYLALPTNPILIVPYSLIQSASLLPAPITGGLQHAPDTAYFLLPDGTLQPMATASISSSPSQSTVRAPQLEKPSRPVVAFHSPPPHIQQQPLKPVVEKAKTNEQPNGSPLDLSCRRSVEKDVVLMDTSEDEKENRLMVHHSNAQRLVSSPEHEDIICAPSIPLMLSTSSTCSSPSPAPLSPASSSSQSACKRGELKRPQSEQSAHSNSPSPKSSIVSPSPQMKSPRRTPNGISGKSRDRHTPEGPPPSWTKENSNINLQSLLLAAVSAQSQMDQLKPDLQNLPFPPEFIPHLTAMYNSRFAAAKAKSMPLPPGMLPPGVSGGGLPPPIAIPMASRSPAEFLNQASLLLTSEMALRLAAAQSSPAADLPPPSVPPPPPQVLVKQGDSKCQECNIVFYKLENYIAHKKHYCSARKLPSAVESSQEEKTPSPLASSPPQTMSPPKSESTKSKSPIGNQIASTSKPGALYQFICAACGIKFTSYDNLTAHQTYYCPKRNPNEPDKARRCNKCKNAVVGDHQCSGSSLGWKCPCCSVVSPTASAAQKHMDTHSGVKAFLCTICRYKGNTLRGMRTHIRMHFDKRPAEINEEKYITCVVEDGTSIIHEPSPSSSSSLLIIDEEPIVVPPPKSASVSARLAPSPSVAVDDKSCNGTSISIKEETSPEEPEDARVVEAPTVVGPEEDEYIEVEDVPGLPVKEEVVDEPSIKIEPDDDVEDKTINNNRQSPGAVGGVAGGVAGTPKYCETCDISFTYLSTFIAHKKFYCTGVVTTDSSINSSSNNNNNNNNNSKRSTGTPVT